MNPHERLRLPLVEADLLRLETLLAESVIFGDEYLDSVTTHLIYAGGKRLRPMLAVASATGGSRPASQDDLLGGVALELMHLASLYHDDVMDEADVRRNVDSVNARYGNLIAIVAGDYLMARSAAIAADLGAEAAGLLARTLAWLTRGQVSEIRTAYSVERTEANYFEAIEGKTASLMASSCHMGALTAGLARVETEALTEFGRCFGMVYQLRDDILDVIAVDNELGKPAGQDLAEASTICPPSSRCATRPVAMSFGPSSAKRSMTPNANARASWSSPPTASPRPSPPRRVSSRSPTSRSPTSRVSRFARASPR